MTENVAVNVTLSLSVSHFLCVTLLLFMSHCQCIFHLVNVCVTLFLCHMSLSVSRYVFVALLLFTSHCQCIYSPVTVCVTLCLCHIVAVYITLSMYMSPCHCLCHAMFV